MDKSETSIFSRLFSSDDCQPPFQDGNCFPKRETHLNYWCRGKCWVACIISTSLRGGLTSLPSSAPTSPSTQIFGIMHGQHNLRSCMMISKSHLFSRTRVRVNLPPTSDPDARQSFLQLPKSDQSLNTHIHLSKLRNYSLPYKRECIIHKR